MQIRGGSSSHGGPLQPEDQGERQCEGEGPAHRPGRGGAEEPGEALPRRLRGCRDPHSGESETGHPLLTLPSSTILSNASEFTSVVK